jgi:hypothetical protein
VSATRPPAYDERYAAPVEASRRGAHRARPNPLTSIVPVVAGMAVVVLVVVGAFTLLGGRGSPDSSTVGAAPTTSPSASTSTGPSTAPTTPAGSASSTASAGADVDKTIALRVRNSTSTQGLAKKFSSTLTADGWTVAETGDANQRGLATTLVYYGKSSQKASAQAVVDTLGFGKVKKSAANAGDGITVVLGADAAAA